MERLVSVQLIDIPLGKALQVIAESGGVRLASSSSRMPADRKVTVTLRSGTLREALRQALAGTGLTATVISGNVLAVVKEKDESALPHRQGGKIVGQVTDAKTGAQVSRADVFLEGTRWRTETDSAGRFWFPDVDSGTYTLRVRRLGYAKQSQRVTVLEGQTNTVDVTLMPQAARLEELVTTATGRQRRADIANDVTVINADSVMQGAPIRSVTDLLEGRVPGLTVQRTSGAPGDPARLRLRGASSPLRNNDPIVVVDGVRVYAEQSAARSGNLADNRGPVFTSHYATPSPIDYIDPNTIETIEVLKGPSAATLYGQDAANGVIVVTTKKGRPGPARWTASVEHGRTQMEGDYPELLFRWGHFLDNDVATNCPSAQLSDGRACQGDSLLTFQLLNDPALTVLDRGHRTAATLGVSGGSQALTYAVTGSYANEVGLIRLPGYETDRYQALLGLPTPDWMRRPQHLTQWGATSRVTAQLGSRAEVSLMAGLSHTEQQRSSLEQQLANLMSTYFDRSSGTYYRSTDNGGSAAVANALGDYYQRATAAATQFTNGVNVDWRLRRWLTFTADAGLNVTQRSDQVYFPRGPVLGVGLAAGGFIGDTTGFVNDAQGTSVVSTVNLRANATAPLGRGFQFRFAAGANYTGTSISDVAGGSRDLAPGSSLQGAVIVYLNRMEQSDATFGWYAEPSVGNSKFNFSSGLRLDGGSSYGSGLSGLSLPKFPKLGFSYLLSDESFFPFKNLFQSFRVRLAYGRASRQPGPTDRLRLYTRPGQEFLDSSLQTGVELQTLGNTKVRPERSTEFEGGFDADLLDSRMTVTVTAYRKTTDDALLSVPVAPSVYGGGVSIIKNIGVMRNTGLELLVGAQLLRSGPVTWHTNLSLSQNRNVVVKLASGVAPFYTDGSIGGGLRVVPGYPLFGRWTSPVLGYADANSNGILEPQEIQLGDSAVYVGATIPNYFAGLNTTVSLWHGAVVVDAGLSYEDGLSQRNDVARQLAIFSRGTQDPTASLAEQVATADLTTLGNGTDYNWIQTVSTLRFNSLGVRYTLPMVMARKIGAQTLSVAMQGSNLGLWTTYRGLDPNVNAFGTGNNVTDTGVLPQPRLWQVRVNVTY